jgi:hypothetical protein
MKLLNNPGLLYLIIILLYCLYMVYFNNTIFSIDDFNHQTSFHYSTSKYTAYNPNYVPTNQGFRVELEAPPGTTSYVPTSNGFRAELEAIKDTSSPTPIRPPLPPKCSPSYET